MPEPEKKIEEPKKDEQKKETEVPTVENSEKKEPDDSLLLDLDAEYKSKLGDGVYNDYKDYPLKERVKMLRAILKGIEKVKPIEEAKNPATPPANATNKNQKPKTLLELNNKDVMFEKFQSQTSFANRAQSWMKK